MARTLNNRIVHGMRGGLFKLSRSRSLGSLATRRHIGWVAAQRFVAGEDIAAGIGVVQSLNHTGFSATLDYLGENAVNVGAAHVNLDNYIATMRAISQSTSRCGLSVKLTALGLDLGEKLAANLLNDLLDEAAKLRPERPIFVRVDMEGSSYTSRTLDIFRDLNNQYSRLGVVLQACLRRSVEDMEALISIGASVRLVKGAYLEPPTVAYHDKRDVDDAYLRLAGRLLSNDAMQNGVCAAIATHDQKIIESLKDHVTETMISRHACEFQMLYGVRRDVQDQLLTQGYPVRVYVPYGKDWYAYFLRRLAERPANVGFLFRSLLREALPWKQSGSNLSTYGAKER